MPVKAIVDNEMGKKWEIIKNGLLYSIKYYEYFESCGWRFLFSEADYTKDAIEYYFDISLDGKEHLL